MQVDTSANCVPKIAAWFGCTLECCVSVDCPSTEMISTAVRCAVCVCELVDTILSHKTDALGCPSNCSVLSLNQTNTCATLLVSKRYIFKPYMCAGK